PVPRPSGQERNRDAQTLAQVEGCIVDGLTVGQCPEIQSVPGASALEALEGVLLQVGGEAAGRPRGGAVERAGAALLGALCAAWLEAEQAENGSHGDGGADGVEVDSGAIRGPLLLALLLGLTHVLAAFACLGEFAVAFLGD